MLVVEDDADIRASIADVLEHQGYDFLGAANGAEALATLRALRRDPAARLPCLILLDLMMPIMDGGTFRTKQVADPELASIPVLLMSAYRDVAEQARALGIEYLPKPIGVRRLMEGIQRYCPAGPCRCRDRAADAPRDAGAPPAIPPSAAVPPAARASVIAADQIASAASSSAGPHSGSGSAGGAETAAHASEEK